MSATPTIVLENGTMLGAMSEPRKVQAIPEIVISSSISSLHRSRSRSRNEIQEQELPAESTALLEQQQHPQVLPTGAEEDNEFEQFILNRTTSESNMLESSIYSELQFSSANVAASAASPAAAAALNASACSRSDSRQSKRTRRKTHKNNNKAKCSQSGVAGVGVGGGVPAATAAAAATAASAVAPPVGSYPPQYTAIYLDPHPHHHHHQANTLASAAASSPFLQSNPESAASFLQYHQFYQQRPMGMAQHPQHPHPHHHHLRR